MRNLIRKITVSSKLLTNFYRFIRGGKFLFSRENLDIKLEETISHDDILFKKAGNKFVEIENKSIDNVSSVLGWVPFKKNKTNLVIYDFFATNYAIRKQKLLRISLVSKNKLVSQKLFLFPGFSILDIDLKDYFKNIDADIVFAELFHPFIRKNHGGADGQFRFWGRYYESDQANNLSTSHSLILKKGIMTELQGFSGRRIKKQFPNFKHKDYSRSAICDTFENNEIKKSYFGFNSIEDKNNNICSITHHSHFVKSYDNEKVLRQCLFLPNFKNLDPIIYIDDTETGIYENDIKISLVCENQVLKEENFTTKGFFYKPVKSIFKINEEKEYLVIIEFKSLSEIYSHVQYKFSDTKLCDQVHLHPINWEINDNLLMSKGETKGTSRKFGYILKRKNQNQSDFFNLHINPKKNNYEVEIVLRLLTDTDNENIKKMKLKIDKPIINLNIRKIFSNLDESMKKVAVVQLESKTDEINGNFLRIDSEKKVVATDHLTGG